MAYQNNVSDTLFADVSEFQVPVDDSYTAAGYRVLSFRSNDGTHVDANFAANHAWAAAAVEHGELDFFLCYYYWRPDGSALSTHQRLVNGAGGPHPKMVTMIDVETGDGNPSTDHSDELNSEYEQLGTWLGSSARVIGYANTADFAQLWRFSPVNLAMIGAGYGSQTHLANQIAHQYTDGNGYGGGLPEGAPPFGDCDMNSADGLSVSDFARACGLGVSVPPPPPTPPPPASGVLRLPTDDSILVLTGLIVGQFLGAS